MSASPDPGTPSSSSAPAGLLRTHPHHHQHHHNLHLSTPPPQPPAAASPQLAMTPHQQALAPACAAPPPSPASASPASRDYRKGNWTLHETLVLITAKRLDDDRRAGGGIGISAPSSSSSPATTPRSAEQRWKWVENYCWAHGCLRSQNQCNDKWDNLLRDYKKVRDFHSRLASNSSVVPSGSGAAAAPLPAPTSSYWAMERHERKERNLPTNLAPEVHDALCDVLSRRAARRGGAAVAPSPAPPLPPTSPPKPLLSQQQQHRPTAPHPPLLQLPPPPPVSVAPAPATTSVSEDEMTTGSSSDSGSSSGRGEPEAKRQRRRQGRGRASEDGRLGSSVVRGATVLARTLAACEEKRERRHRELLELEERRLRLDAERADARRQGFAGLMSAVHSLSAAIHALVSDHAHGRSGDSSR